MNLYARGYGKSWLQHQLKEMLLDAGGTVIVCTPEGTTKQRREKHLTVIEEIRPAVREIRVFYDDL